MILAKDSIRKAIESFINGYKGVHIIDLACPNAFEQVCDEMDGYLKWILIIMVGKLIGGQKLQLIILQ